MSDISHFFFFIVKKPLCRLSVIPNRLNNEKETINGSYVFKNCKCCRFHLNIIKDVSTRKKHVKKKYIFPTCLIIFCSFLTDLKPLKKIKIRNTFDYFIKYTYV